MATDLKSIADKIKAQQSAKEIPLTEDKTIQVLPKEEIKEEQEKEILIKKPKKDENISRNEKKVEALISKIKESNKESKSGDNMIHTRIEEKAFKKLKILNAYGLSTQSIVSFLISDFLEKEEVKILIKQILENELE